MASLIRYLWRQFPNISLVVCPSTAFSVKIGVPVKPKIWALSKNFIIFLWLSPKWLRWHSSNIITIREWRIVSILLLYHVLLTAALSFWMVVMIILELLWRRFTSSSVLSVLSTAPGSKASYSDWVWVSRSCRSTTNITLSTSSNSDTSWAALNEVNVFPAPVVCQI